MKTISKHLNNFEKTALLKIKNSPIQFTLCNAEKSDEADIFDKFVKEGLCQIDYCNPCKGIQYSITDKGLKVAQHL